MAIEGFPPHSNPKIHLEQYSTPAPIAADLLWNAFSLGDITGKNVLDLGCGTGILAFSALFLGASRVTGIDIDEDAIVIANNVLNDFIDNTNTNGKNNPNINFISEDINNLNINNSNNLNGTDNDSNGNNSDINSGISDSISKSISNIDTIIQNPPFGSQKRAKSGADRIFMETASKIAKVVYSFHMGSTEEFVENYFEKLGGTVTTKFRYKFKLSNQYSFHKKEAKLVKVIAFRVEF